MDGTRTIARSLASYGVVPNLPGDQTLAINTAIAHAKRDGVGILLGDAHAVYRHAGVIRIDGVGFDGQGCTFFAENAEQGATFLSGAGVSIRNVRLTGRSPRRGTKLEHCGLVVTASNFRIEDVRIDTDGAGPGFAGAGAMFFGATNGSIVNLRVEGTRADGIHVTYGSDNLAFSGGGVFGSGDDGFAIVSYRNDRRLCRNIVTRDLVIANPQARGLAIVGGEEIRHFGTKISRSSAAAIYVCSEEAFDTFGVRNWQIQNFVASQCVTGIGLAKNFTQAIILVYGRSVRDERGALGAALAVADGIIAGQVTGMGDRAPSALDTNSVHVARIRYELTLDHIRGPNASGYATLLGGKDCSGFIDIHECDGVPFILSSSMTGTHEYDRLSAVSTRMARPSLRNNIHGDGARNFGQPTNATGDNRQASPHRFDRCQPEPLPTRGYRQYVGLRELPGNLLLTQPAQCLDILR